MTKKKSVEQSCLPERLYFSLADAAERLKCKPIDLIHFGVNNSLEICAFIDGEFKDFDIYVSPFEVEGNRKVKRCSGVYCRFNYTVNEEVLDRRLNLLGLFSLHTSILRALEFYEEVEVINAMIKEPVSNSESGCQHHFSISDFTGKFTRDNLYVTSAALRGLSNGTSQRVYEENDSDMSVTGIITSPASENKKSKLIKALIEIHYGKGSSDTARTLFNTEMDTGEMFKDFIDRGIRPPVSGKTLDVWLRDVELEYLEDSNAAAEASRK